MALRIHPDLVLHVVVPLKCPACHVDFQLQFSSSQSHSSLYLRVITFLRFRKLELPFEIGSKSSLKEVLMVLILPNKFKGMNEGFLVSIVGWFKDDTVRRN